MKLSGIGRRLCIGETIARVQLCLVASHIVQHFHLSLAPHDPTPATDTDSSFFRIAPHFRLVATQRRLCTTSAVESGSINAQPTAAFLNRVTPKGTPKDVWGLHQISATLNKGMRYSVFVFPSSTWLDFARVLRLTPSSILFRLNFSNTFIWLDFIFLTSRPG